LAAIPWETLRIISQELSVKNRSEAAAKGSTRQPKKKSAVHTHTQSQAETLKAKKKMQNCQSKSHLGSSPTNRQG